MHALLLASALALSGYEIALLNHEGPIYLHFEGKAPELPTKDWLQFHPTGKDQFALSPAELSPFKVTKNECMGGFDANSTVKAPKAGPAYVIFGLRAKDANVKTALGKEAVVEPDKPVSGTFAGKAFSLTATGTKKKQDGEVVWSGYAVKLDWNGKSQTVFKQGKYQARAVSVLWAGDLDADGRLDLLMNLNYWESAAGVTLFLSSEASGNADLVKDVASDNPEQC